MENLLFFAIGSLVKSFLRPPRTKTELRLSRGWSGKKQVQPADDAAKSVPLVGE